MLRIPTACALAATLFLAACGGDSNAAPTKLRMSGIPDSKGTDMQALATAVEDYLGKELGIEVEYINATSYDAAVTSIAANTIDLGWFGGVTGVDAVDKCDGKARMIATREKDLAFKTYFIANKAAVDAGKIQVVDSLEAMKPMLADLTFTFGDLRSTSGHIMPRHFMVKAGIDPETDVKGGAKTQPSGGHGATLNAVVTGTVDVGAINYTNYEKASDAEKAAAIKIYETPPYVDYCMVARTDLGDEMISKIQTAFTKLDPANPDHKKVLDAFSADKFVAADSSKWQGIRDVVEDLKKKGMLK